jgi:hypothetical protein
MAKIEIFIHLFGLQVLATISCPRCHQLINHQAITCPHCRIALKAYGHPGIPLYRAANNNYLCDSCTYHVVDDTCNFPQRPYAKECILYHNMAENNLEPHHQPKNNLGEMIKSWIKQHQAVLLLLTLLGICFLIVLAKYYLT